jgi:hypothetical protein
MHMLTEWVSLAAQSTCVGTSQSRGCLASDGAAAAGETDGLQLRTVVGLDRDAFARSFFGVLSKIHVP